MYRRILVPLDGSRFSEEIIPYAVGLAAVHGTDLVLARVVDKASGLEDAQAYVDKLAAAHEARGLCLVASGDVAAALLEEVEREPDTLLAMTSRGHSGLMEIILGSVARRVMRGIGGPVLVYHPTGTRDPDGPPIRPCGVVLPLDGHAHSEAMADEAAEFARWIDAELEVVSVIDPVGKADLGEISESGMATMETSYVRTRANDLAKRYGVRINWDVLHGGEPVEAIVSRVAHRNDVILAMATRRGAPLDAAVLGSVAAGCLRKAGVPVLMRLS